MDHRPGPYWAGPVAEPAADDRFMAERQLGIQQASILPHHLASDDSALRL